MTHGHVYKVHILVVKSRPFRSTKRLPLLEQELIILPQQQWERTVCCRVRDVHSIVF